jgi:hypothetical protein
MKLSSLLDLPIRPQWHQCHVEKLIAVKSLRRLVGCGRGTNRLSNMNVTGSDSTLIGSSGSILKMPLDHLLNLGKSLATQIIIIFLFFPMLMWDPGYDSLGSILVLQ